VKAILSHKGYRGEVELDIEAGVLYGRVINVKDVITFQGTSVPETIQAFHDSVDDYLEFCSELGKQPEKPFSGRLPFRTTPERHELIFLAAKLTGKSINAWMDDTLAEAAESVVRATLEPTTSRTWSKGGTAAEPGKTFEQLAAEREQLQRTADGEAFERLRRTLW
jgi:predicted HicB family RNase H-like nuclease